MIVAVVAQAHSASAMQQAGLDYVPLEVDAHRNQREVSALRPKLDDRAECFGSVVHEEAIGESTALLIVDTVAATVWARNVAVLKGKSETVADPEILRVGGKDMVHMEMT